MGTRHHFVSLSLRLSAPWTLLFGPSGSGKSTILRGFAGLETHTLIGFGRRRPDGGWEELAEMPEWRPPHLRQLGWAPQQATLFPHLTVRENIAFPVDARRPRGAADHIAEITELFRLGPLLDRRPAQLSGGEAQRVNLARAFAVPDCRLMLLDEPFSGTDRALRDELLPAMQHWLAARRIPVLSVSHDVEEALQLGAEVVLLRAGRAVAQGPAAVMLADERARMLRTLS